MSRNNRKFFKKKLNCLFINAVIIPLFRPEAVDEFEKIAIHHYRSTPSRKLSEALIFSLAAGSFSFLMAFLRSGR